MYTNLNYLSRKLRGLSLRCLNWVENNQNVRFESNGEEKLLDHLLEKFKTQSKKNYLIFDIGANVGKYAETLVEKANKKKVNIELHLFEPTRECFSSLKSNPNLKGGNLKKNNFGVSDMEGEQVIYYDQPQSGLASLYQRDLESFDTTLDQTETIVLKRLDKYIEQNKISHIDFIKIDIEGHELNAFKGMNDYLNADFIDYIQFEYGGANLDSKTSLKQLYRFFQQRGFKIGKVMPNGVEIRKYQPYMENFFYANYIAISKRVL